MKSLLVFLLSLVLAPVHAAVVSFNPPNSTVGFGATFIVDVNGAGFATELDGGGLNLSFDPTILQLKSVKLDTTEWNFSSDPGTISNLLGTVTGTQFNQFGKAKIGSFAILGYEFQAIGPGTSALTLTEFGLNPFASGGDVVPTIFSPGSVTVMPEPAAGWMLLAGIGVVAFGIARRRG